MSLELRELVDQAYALPYGRARTALMEQVVERADADGTPEEAFHHRLNLVTAYVQGGEPRLMFAPFGRLLATYDADPSRYSGLAYRMLWSYKFAISAMTEFPEVTLAQARQALEDMERRWLAAGHTLHAVYQNQWRVARHIGDGAAAEESFRAWSTTPRDSLSDCEGCDPTEKLEHLDATGRHAEAVDLGRRVLTQDLRCAEQPQDVQTAMMHSLVLEGHLDEARDAHQRGYRAKRTRPGELIYLARHLRFATMTGNPERALEIYARHVGELQHPPHPLSEMEFRAVAARLLTEIDPGRQVHDEFGRPADPPVLAARYRAEALALADRFDARNQTRHQSERIEGLLSETRWVESLPLLALPTLARPSVPARETDQQPGPQDIGADEHPAEAPPRRRLPDPATAGVESLLDLVEEALFDQDEAVLTAALERFETERPAPDRSRQEAGRVHYARSTLHDLSGRVEESASELREAIVCFDAAGDEVRLQRSRASLGLDLLQAGQSDEAVATAEPALHWLIEHDEPRRRWGRSFQLMQLERGTGRVEQAYVRLRALATEPSGHVDRDEHAAVLLAQEEYNRDQYAEAAAAASRAVGSRNADRWRWAHRFRALARRQLDDLDGAIEDHLAALAGCDIAEPATSDPAYVFDLAETYAMARRYSDAAETAELTLRLSGGADRSWLGRVRVFLLRVYRELPDIAIALEQAVALDELTADDDPAERENRLWRAGLVEERGELLAILGRHQEALGFLRRAAEVYRTDGDPIAETRAWRRAKSSAAELGSLEEVDRLWAEALAASERIGTDDVHHWFHQGWLWLDRAESDLRIDRPDDARQAMDRAENAFVRGGLPERQEVVLARAEAFGGDVDELRGLHIDAQEGSRLWYRSGYALAAALHRAGRQAESQALQDRLDADSD